MSQECLCVFITGGTGYMGQRLIPRLLARGHQVRALVRPDLKGNCRRAAGHYRRCTRLFKLRPSSFSGRHIRTIGGRGTSESSRWETRYRGAGDPFAGNVKSRDYQAFERSNLCADQSNDQNYESACPWDIYSLAVADEMVDWQTEMAFEDMDDLHLRIARVTEDLRKIQQELNCAAMQAPSDPELMEALNSFSETEPIETLRVALDQMRHFLWFYAQVMNNEPEFGDKLRQSVATKAASDETPRLEKSFLDQLSRADELVLLLHLAEAKLRKPN